MTTPSTGWLTHGAAIAHAWGCFTPPARPSEAELRRYRRLVSERRGRIGERPVLLLGSTPELRDLLAELGVAFACLDGSSENHRALGALCRQAPSSELIVADWRVYQGGS